MLVIGTLKVFVGFFAFRQAVSLIAMDVSALDVGLVGLVSLVVTLEKLGWIMGLLSFYVFVEGIKDIITRNKAHVL